MKNQDKLMMIQSSIEEKIKQFEKLIQNTYNNIDRVSILEEELTTEYNNNRIKYDRWISEYKKEISTYETYIKLLNDVKKGGE